MSDLYATADVDNARVPSEAEQPVLAVSGSSAAAASPARLLSILLALGTLSLLGVALAIWLSATSLGQPDPRNWFNAFYVVFARNEPVGLALVLLFTAIAAVWLARGATGSLGVTALRHPAAIPALAGAVFFVSALGAWVVFHGYAFTADEYMADFQARLFAAGKIQGEVPPFWRPIVRLIKPTFAVYDPTSHTWMSSYLPVYAAIRSIFMLVGAAWITNCIFAVLSIFCIAGIARRLWPNEPLKPLLAAGLLAASPQFLITSMTGYSMPAHLGLNLLWLWLYCEPRKRRFWLAPLVGVATLGLHQPFVHAVFVAPFLVRLLLDRRWKAVFWFSTVYLIGLGCWWFWWQHFVPQNAGGSAGTFALTSRTLRIQAMDIALLLGWLAFPVPVLACLGFARIRGVRPLLFDAAVSCVLTFGFYIFVSIDQGHGWGYRYFHGTLGCLILVAAGGWDLLAERIGRQAAVAFTVVGLTGALLIQVPVRGAQVESLVRPFANASKHIRRSGHDVVVFDPRDAWYLADLRRNDPLFQQRPVVVASMTMTKEEADALRAAFPNGRVVTRDDLVRLGFDVVPAPPAGARQ